MAVTEFFKSKKTIDRLHEGPLGAFIDIYADRLVARVHSYQSGAHCIRVVGDYSIWLVSRRHRVAEINGASIDQYEQFRKKYRHPIASDHAALVRLLSVLREVNAIEPATAKTLEPLEQLEHEFEQYLRQDRGLCKVSIIRHRPPLRKFPHPAISY